MSKVWWGASALNLLGLFLSVAFLPDWLRIYLSWVFGLGIVVCITMALFAKNKSEKSGMRTDVSTHHIGAQNIATAGRDIYQTIHPRADHQGENAKQQERQVFLESLLTKIVTEYGRVKLPGEPQRDLLGGLVQHYEEFRNEAEVEWMCLELDYQHYDPFALLKIHYGANAFDRKRLKLLKDARRSNYDKNTDRDIDNYVYSFWGEQNGIEIPDSDSESARLAALHNLGGDGTTPSSTSVPQSHNPRQIAELKQRLTNKIEKGKRLDAMPESKDHDIPAARQRNQRFIDELCAMITKLEDEPCVNEPQQEKTKTFGAVESPRLATTAIYDSLDEFVGEGQQMLARFLQDKPPYPSEDSFNSWSERLIAFAGQYAKIEERNRLRKCYGGELKDEEAMTKMDAPKEYWDIVDSLLIRLKITKQIMYRLRKE